MESAIEEFGKALQRCSTDLPHLMNDNLGEEVYLTELTNPKAWQFLVSHDLIHGNEQEGYTISTLLSDVILSLMAEEVRRKNAPDVADWLEDVRRAAEQLRLAEQGDNATDVRRYRSQIRQLVLTMTAGLASETLSLRFNLASNFGTCSNLDQKLIENRYLTRRTGVLVEKLKALETDVLLAVAGENPFLVQQLYIRLRPRLDECRNEMLEAIPKLEKMMFKFQQHSAQEKRLLAMERHLNSGQILGYEPTDEELSLSMFNHIDNEEHGFEAHSPLDFNGIHQPTYIEIVRKMKKPDDELPTDSAVADEGPVEHKVDDPEDNPPPPPSEYNLQFLDFIKAAKRSREPMRCMNFWSGTASHLNPNAFLHHMDAELAQIPQLKVTRHTLPSDDFSSLEVVTDVTLHIPGRKKPTEAQA